MRAAVRIAGDVDGMEPVACGKLTQPGNRFERSRFLLVPVAKGVVPSALLIPLLDIIFLQAFGVFLVDSLE